MKINLETIKINSIEEDIFCRTFIEIISKKSDIITIKVILMKKDLNEEILKEINEKKIKISMKLNNNNYTSIPLNNNLQIGYKDIFISFIFEIKK